MEQDLPKDAERVPSPAREPLSWLTKIDRGFVLVKGLSLVTVLSSLVVGYFQYLNSYQEKVSAQAKENMQAATKALNDISTKFTQVQALQQQLFSDFSIALDDHADADAKALAVKGAPAVLKSYEEAQLTLLEAGDLLARNAETDIDWAANFGLNPADRHTPSSDPLEQSLLRAYDFDCNDNLPQFQPVPGSASKVSRTQPKDTCPGWDRFSPDPENSYVNVCPKNSEKAAASEAITIHWFSAKHHVMVMHYCLRGLHEKMTPVRNWASQAEAKPANRALLEVDRDRIQTALDLQSRRLSAFMNLGTFQINGLRESYRPDSFACHVPIVTSIVGRFNDACTPVKTTSIFTLRH